MRPGVLARTVALAVAPACGPDESFTYDEPVAEEPAAPEPQCTPGARECSGATTARECGADSRWRTVASCAAGETCEAGACVVPPLCVAGARVCGDDAQVIECAADGGAWSAAETCETGFACDGGACVTLCEHAASTNSFVGCEFFSASIDGWAHTLTAANPNIDVPTPASVTVETRIAGAWTVQTSFEVLPAANTTATVQATTPQAGYTAAAAYRVTSTLPIVLYQMQVGGYEGGGTLIFPTAALGDAYLGLTPGVGQLLAIAVADSTLVTTTPTVEVNGGAGVPVILAGTSWTGALSAGDALLLASAGDLTGTRVEADSPVALFATGLGSAAGGQGDRIEEQLLPIDRYGQRFLAARIVGTDNPGAPTLWRFVASEDATTLSFEAGEGTTGLPASVTLDAGQWWEATTYGHFYAEADRPVLAAEFVTSDLDMAFVPPIELYLPRYFFTNVAGEGSETLTVIAEQDATVLLDGAPWSGAWIDAGGGYAVSQLANPTGNHTLEATVAVGPDEEPAPPAVLVRSNAGLCTFSYVGGLSLEPINATLK